MICPSLNPWVIGASAGKSYNLSKPPWFAPRHPQSQPTPGVCAYHPQSQLTPGVCACNLRGLVYPVLSRHFRGFMYLPASYLSIPYVISIFPQAERNPTPYSCRFNDHREEKSLKVVISQLRFEETQCSPIRVLMLPCLPASSFTPRLYGRGSRYLITDKSTYLNI